MRRLSDRPAAGMTLLEVCVAIALLALVVAGAVAAASTGLQAWLAAGEAAARDRREASWSNRIHAAVSGIVPVTVPAESPPFPAPVLFRGSPERVRFVTLHSPFLAGRGGARIVELRVQRLAGRVRLVLADVPGPAPFALGAAFDDPADGSPAFRTVFDNLLDCQLRYLDGPEVPGAPSTWVPRWERPGAIPRAIRIAWTDRDSERRGRITAVVPTGMADPVVAGRPL